MADERDQWLDKDTAERLLRGDSVESLDAYAGAEAARVASALRDLALIAHANEPDGPERPRDGAGSPGTTGPTPGETAAVAAFRRARQDRTSAHTGRAPRTEGTRLDGSRTGSPRAESPRTESGWRDGGWSDGGRRDGGWSDGSRRDGGWSDGSRSNSGRTAGVSAHGVRGGDADRGGEDTLAPVRIAPVPATEARARWCAFGRALTGGQGRPRGGGLAAVFVGCVLGSAALAVGSGALFAPASTDSHETPPPAVSPTEGPAPSASGGNPYVTRAPGGPLPGGAGAGPWESVGKQMLSLGGTGVADSTRTPGPSASAPRGGHSVSPGASTPAARYAAAVDACQALRDGTIDHRHRAMLVRLAKGEHGAAVFCAHLLAGLPEQSDGDSASPRPSGSGGFGVYDPGGSSASNSPWPATSPPDDGSSTVGPNGQHSVPPSEPADGTSSAPEDGTSGAPAPGGTESGGAVPPGASPSASPDAASAN
ncbi:hypothetical protein [Streptomyces sp. 8L]|uniref:hypothetical protein n=1 Tax=Streptomyces sp. 8L TaxID=2877242 RepID=UPI001CD7005B|nr:hypothetical protein [Streptomyces sp. 8L]MCA1218821.1 hypothetical protein [Streptomyces sp. 8L]